MTALNPVSSIFLLLTCALQAGEAPVPAPSTRDPVRDYLHEFETQAGEQLVSARADLNGDGVDEIFLSRSSLANGRQGNIWVLYESQPDGSWKRHDAVDGGEGGAIEFHPKAASVQPDGKGRKQLIRYSPGSSTSGRLSNLQLRNGHVTETLRPEEIQPGGGDAALYDRYFGDPGQGLAFEWRDMSALRAKYLPFNGWFHEITAGKLAFLALCAFVPLWLLRKILRLIWPARPARQQTGRKQDR